MIDFKGLIIDNDSHRCTLYDEVLNLTPIEFSILWYLCKNRGRVITSEEPVSYTHLDVYKRQRLLLLTQLRVKAYPSWKTKLAGMELHRVQNSVRKQLQNLKEDVNNGKDGYS